jgi:asparagine synthase (glutamine-hydrolysing)
MYGLVGVISLPLQGIDHHDRRLVIMNKLQRHRGPDAEGIWTHEHSHVSLAYRRLSVIDLAPGQQSHSCTMTSNNI